ncbi:hypothetical protein H0H81_001743 [Sphagnurus paluster]|uniref:Uncharacterized protein n=1 Tax=Sphagnurus paluster TaxID=117069 RepID=A0A9P7KHK1_9AGAR|nr:hypothetical protein H0H81_001743 [Sphagnurus paluster]
MKEHYTDGLVDTRAFGEFIDEDFVVERGLPTRALSTPVQGLNINGTPIDDADATVIKQLRGEYTVMASDVWKDESRDSINGVNISVSRKTYLIDLILATSHKKDGDSMRRAFEGMINNAEDVYQVVVVAFCCDNDGGSQGGRKDLFQLILGEYFTGNKEAAEVAEQATDLIGWVLNHGKVRSVFKETQAETSVPPGKGLAFLVANMTRWTTHFIAFDHLTNLKDSMRRTVISCKDDIISVQVGAEKNRQKRQKLEDNATAHCKLIDGPTRQLV